jgi:hypothetical protein
VSQLARAQAGQRAGAAGDRRPRVRRWVEGGDLEAVAIQVAEMQRAVAVLVRDAVVIAVAGGVVERAASPQLPAGVVVSRGAGGAQLQRVRLVAAAQVGVVADPLHLGEPELDGPAGDGLIEVGDPQRDVVDPPQLDHGAGSAATTRSASSSGIASATCRVFADTCS